MALIFEGKDITNDIEIKKAELIDNAGGELDSIELVADDPQGLWSRWKPAKNNTLQIKENGFDSGLMYVDEIIQQRGTFTIKSLPIRQESKLENIKAWDNVRFLELAQEFASKHGLMLETYGINNHLYNRVDQYEQADFEFLAWRCLLEGYALKISNNKLIIFNEQYMESQAPVKTITPDDIDGNYTYKDKSTQIYGACKIFYEILQYTFSPVNTYGPTLKIYDLAVNSIGEAERFSKGLLRAKNRVEKTFIGTLKSNQDITAGSTVKLSNFGLADGNYFVQQAIHKYEMQKITLKLRRPLEGY